jgi:hypothetical protein
LTGPFFFATATGQIVAGLSFTAFWSPDLSTYGLEYGPSFGEGVAIGGGVTYTKVHQLHGWTGRFAKLAWDVLNPHVSVPQLLDSVFAWIQNYLGAQTAC